MQVEEGYECTGLQPSTCRLANAHTTSAATGTPEFATKMHKCLRVYKQRHRELSCTVMQADQICTTQKRKHVQSIAAWLHTMFAKIKLIVKNERTISSNTCCHCVEGAAMTAQTTTCKCNDMNGSTQHITCVLQLRFHEYMHIQRGNVQSADHSMRPLHLACALPAFAHYRAPMCHVHAE